MRFIAAQFDAYLSNDLWRKNALHANEMARRLKHSVDAIPAVEVTQKVETNGVFAVIPTRCIPVLQKEFFFYIWDEKASEVRWMTSFDTQETDIEAFAELLSNHCV